MFYFRILSVHCTENYFMNSNEEAARCEFLSISVFDVKLFRKKLFIYYCNKCISEYGVY